MKTIDWIERATRRAEQHKVDRQQQIARFRGVLDEYGIQEMLEAIAQQVWGDGSVRFASKDWGNVGACGYELTCTYEDVIELGQTGADTGWPAVETLAGVRESALSVMVRWKIDGFGRFVPRDIRVSDTPGAPVDTESARVAMDSEWGPALYQAQYWTPISLSESESEQCRLLETFLAESCAQRLANGLTILDLRHKGRERLDRWAREPRQVVEKDRSNGKPESLLRQTLV